MKKIISIISLLLIAATLFTACSKVPVNPNETGTTASGDTTTTAEPEKNRTEYPIMDLFAANLDQYIKLGDHTTIKLELNVAVTEEDVVATLEKEMLQLGIQNDIYTLVTDRVTAEGDILDINFVGKLDGVAFANGSANNQKIPLTDDTGYIPGFDKDLYGIMPGTTVNTTVTFPEDYDSTELAGKEAVFEIKVNGIYHVELTDENIKTLTDGQYTSYDALKAAYHDNMIINNLNNYENNLYTEVIKQLKELSEVVLLPEAQVNYYYYDMLYFYEDDYDANKALYELYYGITTFEEYLAGYGITDELMLDQAKLCALEDIILASAAKKLGCTLTDEEYSTGVDRLVSEWTFDSREELLKSYDARYLKLLLTKEKTMKLISDQVEVTTDYDTYKHLLDKAETETE